MTDIFVLEVLNNLVTLTRMAAVMLLAMVQQLAELSSVITRDTMAHRRDHRVVVASKIAEEISSLAMGTIEPEVVASLGQLQSQQLKDHPIQANASKQQEPLAFLRPFGSHATYNLN